MNYRSALRYGTVMKVPLIVSAFGFNVNEIISDRHPWLGNSADSCVANTKIQDATAICRWALDPSPDQQIKEVEVLSWKVQVCDIYDWIKDANVNIIIPPDMEVLRYSTHPRMLKETLPSIMELRRPDRMLYSFENFDRNGVRN